VGAVVMIARVRLWGRDIGAVAQGEGDAVAAFQYAPDFVSSGIEVSPLAMPLSSQVYQFPALAPRSFHGLPGLLADSLPDKFGNALIDAWLARQGRAAASFGAVERLCYTGTRGMGALEFSPEMGPRAQKASKIEIDALVDLASEVLANRDALTGSFQPQSREKALTDILRVGTSAGGARAKAIIAWNEQTQEVRSGQVRAGEGFEYWLLKFDGVQRNRDKELDDPEGFGAIEYAYHLMARAAGIEMNDCRLLEENGRRHFMTKRFDRLPDGEKLHMQSLGALAHYDFNEAGAHSYEQALLAMHKLALPPAQIEQQFRRMLFNVVARNQDDHVKNIAFLMDRSGRWSLSPAFDVCYSYNPGGAWTATHQMSINGRRDGFSRADFSACAKIGLLKKGRSDAILDEVRAAVARWPEFAAVAKVSQEKTAAIARAHRLSL